MLCPNCKREVPAGSSYCTACGLPVGVRQCPNGHSMDPSWTECKLCPPGAAAASGYQGQKGRTVVESPSGPPPGGFTKGATLLEGDGGSGGGAKRSTTVEYPSGSSRSKQKTVFDPGTAPTPGLASRGAVAPPKPRLVGWLVTFTHDSSGEDLRLREGRNTIGAGDDSDLTIRNDPAMSARHAVMICRDGKFWISDEKSMNGTLVNGKDIFPETLALQPGDRIRMGGTEFVLHVVMA